MAIFKNVEVGTGTFQKTNVNLGQNSLTGLNTFDADKSDINSEYGHFFTSFNLPITANQEAKYSITMTNGGFLNTAFSGFDQTNILVIEIPRTEYGELIDGKTIKLEIQTGATVSNKVTSYSTFVYKAGYTTTFDTLYSDGSSEAEEYGQPVGNGQIYHSNVAFLMSDDVKKPQGDSSKSWATGYNSAVAFYSAGKEPLTYFDGTPSKIDQPIGIAYLDKGFMVITNQNIVNSYVASGITITFDSFNTEYIQHVVCLAGVNEFYTTQNPTFLEAYGTAGVGTESVLISEVGLYNANGDLIAIAKPDRPIPKSKNGLVVFDIQIKI